MTTYRIEDKVYSAGSDGLSSALDAAKRHGVRPVCLCREPGQPMYIASVSGRLTLKRMPNSGGNHAPSCDSYEPPAELSGLGQVLGSAIQENPEDGMTALKLGFSLTKTSGRAAPVLSATESDSVKTDGTKLTLRGTLHYLWDQAGFNRWSPAMAGRRSWYTVRKYLLQAADGKTTKGSKLSELLYVPEPFSAEHKDEIAQRRMAFFSRATGRGANGSRSLLVAIGEVKEIASARFGHKIIFKHVPDAHFMLNEDLHKRLVKRFELELGLVGAVDGAHLIAIASFGVGDAGVASIEEIALMPVTENWIPFETNYDKLLIDKMTGADRRFVKGLRYNLASDRPLACMVASDTGPMPTAMYISTANGADSYHQALETLMTGSAMRSWIWRANEGEMPALPARS